MGYHLDTIPKGMVGEISKIEEELHELKDALNQNNRIMALLELSDLLGAIILFMKKRFPDFKIRDLEIMAEATMSAFEDGTRKETK